MITIDSFAVKVDLIKLDVEGMELRALERPTNHRHRPYSWSKQTPIWSRSPNTGPSRVSLGQPFLSQRHA